MAPTRTLAVWFVCAVACGDDASPKDPIDAGASDAAETDASDDGAVPIDPDLPVTAWQPMFENLPADWYEFLPSKGRDSDPEGVFEMRDGVLHILGIAAPPGDQEFGYIATRADYDNYRFRVEQRWGTQKFAPRIDAVRDSGLLFHLQGGDAVWPQCPEFQIQENDTGDLHMLGDVGATTRARSTDHLVFDEGGEVRTLRSTFVQKGGTFDSLTEWNTLELIASGREFMHIVNRHVNHRGWALEHKRGDAWEPLDRGRIGLQAEGAEVFYRNAQLRPLGFAQPPSDAVKLFDGSGLGAFQNAAGGEPGWRVVEGALEVEPGAGDLQTRETFGDIRLHVEFRLPVTSGDAERAASAVMLRGHAIALRDSFGSELSAASSGAIGSVAPRVDEALPPESWQSLDVVFRPSHITVVYNGSEIHRQLALETEPGAVRIQLADRGSRVRFRNLWLQRL